ncbi:MAG: hypothetical protein ACRCXC_03585 [Legionella sp.]
MGLDNNECNSSVSSSSVSGALVSIDETATISGHLEKGLHQENHFTTDEHSLFKLIPNQLLVMIKEAVKQGTLISFLFTLSDEVVMQLLKEQCDAEQIYWINQAIRALTLVAVGASPWIMLTVLTVPMVDYLINQFLEVDKTNTNKVIAGASFAYALISSPLTGVEPSVEKAANWHFDILYYGFFPPKTIKKVNDNEADMHPAIRK